MSRNRAFRRNDHQGHLGRALSEHPSFREPSRAQRDAGPEVLSPCLQGEQRKRFLARLDEPGKRWKFEMGDVAERKLWDKYQEAYEDAIRETSREGSAVVRRAG